jgi:hypothetical protein
MLYSEKGVEVRIDLVFLMYYAGFVASCIGLSCAFSSYLTRHCPFATPETLTAIGFVLLFMADTAFANMVAHFLWMTRFDVFNALIAFLNINIRDVMVIQGYTWNALGTVLTLCTCLQAIRGCRASAFSSDFAMRTARVSIAAAAFAWIVLSFCL